MQAKSIFISLTGFGLLAVGLAACMQLAPPVSGQVLYEENCAVCHGPGGRGDGPAAGAYSQPVPDLTTLAARNDGTFPMRQVMSQIDGYTRGARVGQEGMPEMGALLEGEVVRFDSGDGILTPTPVKLIALAEYLENIQR